MKIGVYVGSFNPVHKGHMKIVRHLIENKYLDKVLIIPTRNYWNKQNLIDIKDRINMLKMYQSDSIIIDTNLNYLKYTYEIFEKLPKDNSYSLILGADNIINFDKWKNYKELLKHNLIIINRDNIDINYYLKKHKIKNYTIVDDLPLLDISSTMIRNLIKEKKHSNLLDFVDEKVLDYIQKNFLYKNYNDTKRNTLN